MQGKKLFVTAKQTEIYLKPLFKSLRKRELDKDILNCLTKIVEAMSMREYSLAGDYYIQMAVGNAPWPIGVTMVGIHERSAREKIFSNQVARMLFYLFYFILFIYIIILFIVCLSILSMSSSSIISSLLK